MSQTLLAYCDDYRTRDGSQPPAHSELFWFDDLGKIYLQVEKTVYKVHSFFLLRDSAVFRDMFQYITRTPSSVEGLTEERPLHLHGTTKAELDSLLHYYYHGMKPDYSPTVRTWIHLLEVSSRFVFIDLHAAAVSALTELKDGPNGITPLHKVTLALKFNISHWLRPAYIEIVGSVELLDMEIASQLPVVIFLLLTRSRELFRAHENWLPGAPVREAGEIVEGELLQLGIDPAGNVLN